MSNRTANVMVRLPLPAHLQPQTAAQRGEMGPAIAAWAKEQVDGGAFYDAARAKCPTGDVLGIQRRGFTNAAVPLDEPRQPPACATLAEQIVLRNYRREWVLVYDVTMRVPVGVTHGSDAEGSAVRRAGRLD